MLNFIFDHLQIRPPIPFALPPFPPSHGSISVTQGLVDEDTNHGGQEADVEDDQLGDDN